jgi:hypothetical protein
VPYDKNGQWTSDPTVPADETGYLPSSQGGNYGTAWTPHGGGFVGAASTPDPGTPPATSTPYSPGNVYWTPNGIMVFAPQYDSVSNQTKYTWVNAGTDINGAATTSGIPVDVLSQIVDQQKQQYNHDHSPPAPQTSDLQYESTHGTVSQALHDDPLSPFKVTGYKPLGAFGNGLKADYVTTPVTTNMTPMAPPAPMQAPSAFGNPAAGTGASHGDITASAPVVGTPQSDPTQGSHGGGAATGGTPATDPTTGSHGAYGAQNTTNGPQSFDWGTQSGDAWTYGQLPAGSEAQLDTMAASTGIPKEMLRQSMLSQVKAAQDTLIQTDRQQRMGQSRFLTGVGRANAGFTPIGF